MKIKTALIPYFLVILLVFFVFLPMYHDFLDQESFLEREKEELRIEEDYLLILKESEKQLDQYKDTLEIIKTGLSEDPSIASLTIHFEELPNEISGVELSSVGPFLISSVPERPNIKQATLTMRVVAENYQKVKEFLRAIENSVKVNAIESVSIALAESDLTNYSVSVTLKTYSY
jgi:hypothetical protein